MFSDIKNSAVCLSHTGLPAFITQKKKGELTRLEALSKIKIYIYI